MQYELEYDHKRTKNKQMLNFRSYFIRCKLKNKFWISFRFAYSAASNTKKQEVLK